MVAIFVSPKLEFSKLVLLPPSEQAYARGLRVPILAKLEYLNPGGSVKDRIGVTGHSHGGLMTVNLLAHSDLFRAGVARKRRLAIRVLRWPYHEDDRAQTECETVGHIKVLTDRRGKILGATIVGAAAGELITAWTLAINRGLNIRALAGMIVPYPTLAEIGKRAAVTYFLPSVTSVWVRRIIVFLRRFG